MCWCVQLLSYVQLVATPWTVAYQEPLSMEFFRKEYWNGLPVPNPEDLPDPGMEPVSLEFPALKGRFFTTVPLGEPFSSISQSFSSITQSCLTLCDPMNRSTPASDGHIYRSCNDVETKGKKVEWHSELWRAFRVPLTPSLNTWDFLGTTCSFASVNLQRFILFTFQGAQEKGVQPHCEGGLWQIVGFLHLLIQVEDIFTV